MRHLLTVIILSVIAFVVYNSLDWDNIDLSLSIPSNDNKPYDKQSKAGAFFENIEGADEDIELWIDTVMYAKGHAFGYSGDISMWGGWYLDTIFVGDDYMLRYDSVGPSTLKLSLVTRELTIDLGDKDAADKIRTFLNPINGFHRFQLHYEECLDSVMDEEDRIWKYMGEFSFTTDYPDSSAKNANKINRFICELTESSEIEKTKIPGLSALYAGFNPTKNYRPVYTGDANNMQNLSDFLAHKTFENWIRKGEFGMDSNKATLAVKPCIANTKYVTFSVFEYEREGIGHGMYTETFHTFDIKSGKGLTNRDIFKSQHIDKIKMRLLEVMANDPYYRAWNGETISPADIQSDIERWQSRDPVLEGTEGEEPERDVSFKLPDGALTNAGVIFSFQPYEIDCWAAGTFHFIVPYEKLMPYLTPKVKRMIRTLP